MHDYLIWAHPMLQLKGGELAGLQNCAGSASDAAAQGGRLPRASEVRGIPNPAGSWNAVGSRTPSCHEFFQLPKCAGKYQIPLGCARPWFPNPSRASPVYSTSALASIFCSAVYWIAATYAVVRRYGIPHMGMTTVSLQAYMHADKVSLALQSPS